MRTVHSAGMSIVPSGRAYPKRRMFGESRGMQIVPSGEIGEVGMTVIGALVGVGVGAGLMHLAHTQNWFGMGTPAQPQNGQQPPATTPPATTPPATTTPAPNPGGYVYRR